MNTCEYCRGDLKQKAIMENRKEPGKGDRFPGIGVYVAPKRSGIYVVSVANTYEPNYTEGEAHINYCPMCGRKL